MVQSHHRRGLGTLYSHYRQWFMTKIHVFRLVMLVRRQIKHWGSISNTTLGPSGHDSKPPSSRLETLYSHCRQWFMTVINVLGLVLFIRYQFKCCGLVNNTTLGPSGHGKKPPSSRLGTLYSHYKQWFMTKIHVLRIFFCPTSIQALCVDFKHHTGPRWLLYEATIVEAEDLVQLL